ncbi:glycosyltransferase family A protein [Tateyamaria sp. ANG-S1]|uniref:glycosyltransferase n=1 Tax=Tateyamaria sp. ANG-S1 TaxID=1577905 RepID=UPI00057D1E62|nr:glycosyltransferase family A protein [Tateyamaria sp. ANG-S1]KIC45478.1 glycosyl transferase [Tateyamaria sp. ANG-S1]
MTTRTATVIIGRNEGARLVACLASVPQGMGDVVYVDSGSTDGSIAAAQAAGACVIPLDMSQPFTAARARNAGITALKTPHDYIQFIDGDCTLDPEWVPKAHKFLTNQPDVAVVCGRRRERFPSHSMYNRLCDFEWNTPVGETKACGGDALMRLEALNAVGGFNPSLIAGEEPELCVRLRAAGWRVWRLDAEMTLHDAAITRFGQFWQRAKRSGHAFAEGTVMHGDPPERHGVEQTRRALVWGAGLPLGIVAMTLIFGPSAFALALVYPLQVVRLAMRDGGTRPAWERSLLLTIGKFAEARGALSYHMRRLRGRQAELIEYK